MDIKDELVLKSMTWAASDQIEYNNIGEFQTSYSNTTGCYIVQWTGHSYILQGKYICHAFDPPVLIPESVLFFSAKFMTRMRKTSYWYHDPDEEIHVMVKLKQVAVPYIKFFHYNNTTDKLPSRYKG